MEFNKTIAARQSVRKFTEAQITNEQLKAILEAANAAPACMGQYDHLHLTVVQKPEILVQINAAFQKAVGDPNMQVTYGAPTVIHARMRMKRLSKDAMQVLSWRICCLKRQILVLVPFICLA